MTVDYSKQLERGRKVDIFYRLLKLWKGSLYKLIWMDLLIYISIYYSINFIYRFALKEHQKKTFVKVVQFGQEMKEKIPFSFILGFFVAGVIVRWIKLYLLIPWLHRPALIFEGYVNGNDTNLSRRLRRTLLRYLNLAWILQMYKISEQISSRFHQKESKTVKSKDYLTVREILIGFNRDSKIQETYGKIITDAEIKTFETIASTKALHGDEKYSPEYWIPLQWASRIVQKCYFSNYVSDPGVRDEIIKELESIRNNMHDLHIFCQMMMPLVYTQVVILAVYSFFVCDLLASQILDAKEKIPGYGIDIYFPVFSVIQFIFQLGWLKVALCVMNPFGDDDEDFQTSDILDINLDCTFRSVSGESYMFPENMDPPKMIYESSIKHLPDNLEAYLDEMESDIMKSLEANI